MNTILNATHLIILSGFFYVNEPVLNMREEPSHDSKVDSQALYAEQVTVDKEENGWMVIKTSEQYGGWVPVSAVIQRSAPYETSLKVSRLAAHLYGVKDTEYGPIKTLPYGTKLQELDATDPRWIKVALPDDREAYIQKGDVAAEPTMTHKGELAAFSQKFLGLPYTWGGRSSFGYDCSGFVQMLYQQIGLSIPRNSRQQAADERFQTIPIEALEPGDLIFFGTSTQRIVHVGLSLGEDLFIHATTRNNQPWIRISSLKEWDWSAEEGSPLPYRIAKQWKKGRD